MNEPGPPTLRVEYCGEIHEIGPHEALTFGRAADLVIDTNVHLHRILGRLVHRHGLWWLRNEGASLSIVIADLDSRSNALVAPGTEVVITYTDSAIRFRAGPTDYEVLVHARPNDDRAPEPEPSADDSTATFSYADMPLTDEQRLLLAALAEPRLRDPHGGLEVGTNREIAHRLGWSITKLNRKLDNLCDKFSRAGVSGLRGSSDRLATDRRQRLAQHVVEAGVIDHEDLDLLP